MLPKSELETAKVDPKEPFRSAAGAARPLARKEPVRRRPVARRTAELPYSSDESPVRLKPVARRTAELPPSSDKSSDQPPETSRFKQGARPISEATFNSDRSTNSLPRKSRPKQMTRFPMDNPEEGKAPAPALACTTTFSRPCANTHQVHAYIHTYIHTYILFWMAL